MGYMGAYRLSVTVPSDTVTFNVIHDTSVKLQVGMVICTQTPGHVGLLHAFHYNVQFR